MAQDNHRRRRLAVLIDAENTSHRIATRLFEEIAGMGEAIVRRCYGDFSAERLKSWAGVFAAHAIVPHQTALSTTGKNAADIALVIDAMDLLLTGRYDGFCLVSSDGDFTRLATRIREQGLDVFGFGEKKAPDSFRTACKRFIDTEALAPAVKAAPERLAAPVAVLSAGKASPPRRPMEAVPLILRAISRITPSNSWTPLTEIGTKLRELDRDFKPGSFGCSKLSKLIEKTGAFDVQRDQSGVQVRLRQGRAPHVAPERTGTNAERGIAQSANGDVR